MTQNRPKKANIRNWSPYSPVMTGYLNLCREVMIAHTHRRTDVSPVGPPQMKTDSAAQAAPFSGRKQSLIEDARRERSSGSAGSPGPSRYGDGFVFEEKDGRVTLNVLFTLSNEKNTGFFKTGKIFEVSVKFLDAGINQLSKCCTFLFMFSTNRQSCCSSSSTWRHF